MRGPLARGFIVIGIIAANTTRAQNITVFIPYALIQPFCSFGLLIHDFYDNEIVKLRCRRPPEAR